MKINKIKYVLLTSYLLLLTFLVSCSPPANKTIGKPNIYFLKDIYGFKFYVYDNFQDNETCIKYLFNFSNNKIGYLNILTNKNAYKYEDGVAFLEDTISQRFIFARERELEGNNNNTRNFSIRVKFKPSKVDFQIKESKNEEKIPIKKLSADFDSLNVNIVQNFLDYAFDEDYKARKESENYIYELYNKNNKLKIRQIYHDFGKWFDIKIF